MDHWPEPAWYFLCTGPEKMILTEVSLKLVRFKMVGRMASVFKKPAFSTKKHVVQNNNNKVL